MIVMVNVWYTSALEKNNHKKKSHSVLCFDFQKGKKKDKKKPSVFFMSGTRLLWKNNHKKKQVLCFV